METILDRILEQKKMEIAKFTRYPKFVHQSVVSEKILITNVSKRQMEISIIAEFKRASPSKGVINNWNRTG